MKKDTVHLEMKKIILVGCGNLGNMIAKGVKESLAAEYEIAAVSDAFAPSAQKLAESLGVPVVNTPEEMIAIGPDYVVEAATGQAAAQLAPVLIEAGLHVILLSVGALADEKLRQEIEEKGKRSGGRLYVASGAVGGFDLMRAVRFGGLEKAQIHTSKAPRSLNGAPYLCGEDLPETQEKLVFEGNAEEAIAGFPKNVNVAVATALGTLGTKDTDVKISSVPGLLANEHEISLGGAFGSVQIKVSVNPSPDNPKSSALAAWSVLALLEKLASVIQL